MTVPGLLNTWQRGRYPISSRQRSIAVSATGAVPSGFAWDGRLMTQGQFLEYVKTTDISWATKGAVVHHTASPTESQWRQYGGWAHYSISMAQYYHGRLGWHSGPHAFISYEGIGVFTPMSVKGIHAGSTANATTIGMETVGNFTSTLPSGATLDNAVWAFACVLWKLGKTAKDAMYPHRYFGSTACPGAKWYANFSWFEGLVDAKIAEIKLAEEGEPDPPDPPDPTLEERVTELEGLVSALDESVTMLEERVATLEETVANLAAWQTTADSRIASLESWKGEHEPDGK